MKKQYEVWAYSAYAGDYTREVGRYETLAEAERVADEVDGIVIQPNEDDKHMLFKLNEAIVLGVRTLIYVGGVGHVPHYSLFSLPETEHIGFVKAVHVNQRIIDASKVAFN